MCLVGTVGRLLCGLCVTIADKVCILHYFVHTLILVSRRSSRKIGCRRMTAVWIRLTQDSMVFNMHVSIVNPFEYIDILPLLA
jgi:hypothetical protein